MSGGPAELVKKHFVEDTETSLLDGVTIKCNKSIQAKYLAQHLECKVFFMYTDSFA